MSDDKKFVEQVARSFKLTDAGRAKIAAHTKRRRQERDQLMRDMGLVKVKGAVSGRTYWE